MTVTVSVEYVINKTVVVPNVSSTEEAESIVEAQIDDELLGQDYDIVSIDSFEGEEEEVN